jgi:peptidoglycan/LPS O-acetylase OafA/YrhL
MIARILVKFFWATLAVVLSHVAAFVATLADSGGFWQYFWLGACLVSCSSGWLLTILACRQLR